MKIWRHSVCLLATSLTAGAMAQENLTNQDYTKVEYMVPMRDGIKLHTVVLAPKSTKQGVPFMLQRTPYGTDGIEIERIRSSSVKEGFIFVFQDIRGRYKSEGTFVMMRPTRAKSHAPIDEATDAYDTIDWLIKNIPHNNGRAAISGTSYLGWTSLQAAANPHPALKLAMPAASPLDMFLNDDFHRNGAFRLSYGFEYSYMMETSKENEQFKFDLPDTYDWYLRLGALSNANEKYLHGKLPTWNGFLAHPNHDSYWTNQSVADQLITPKVPILSIGGFYDQEDPWGPQETFRLLQRNDPKGWNHIILGPWNHGGWGGSKLGAIDFGPAAGAKYGPLVESLLVAYLKDRGSKEIPTAQIYISGTNEWKSFSQWPPKAAVPTKLYIQPNYALGFNKPKSKGYNEYLSDPANPVPYRKRPIEATYAPTGSGWSTWQVQDQRFLADRKDVLSYSTAALDKPITIAGQLSTDFVASTSGTDSDWIVKVIDVYPNDGSPLAGYQLPINMEVLRARFRDSLVKPSAVPSNKPVSYHLDLHATGHTFLPGHRIMVQIQSSWFPVIDRNPQTFVPNIYMAKDSDYKPATQRIYFGSSITLPILK